MSPRDRGNMKKDQQLRNVVADTAHAVLIARSYDPEVGPQIAALLSRLDDTLSYEQALEELKVLRAGPPIPSARSTNNSTIEGARPR